MFIKTVNISTVDEGRREVSGIVTAQIPDKDGEVCDYASTKPYYQSWSDRISKATDGRSKGNLREMHQLSAVGVGKAIEFDEILKQIRMTFKVVDDPAWWKVQEGCYSAFSQGGEYVRKWRGPDGSTWYTAKPVEISLVDSPALPEAVIEFTRADGTRELRKMGKGKSEVVSPDSPLFRMFSAQGAIREISGKLNPQVVEQINREIAGGAALPPAKHTLEELLREMWATPDENLAAISQSPVFGTLFETGDAEPAGVGKAAVDECRKVALARRVILMTAEKLRPKHGSNAEVEAIKVLSPLLELMLRS